MAQRIPLYPRRDYAKKLAKEFLIKSKVKALLINPFAICKQHGFVIRSVNGGGEIFIRPLASRPFGISPSIVLGLHNMVQY